MKVFSTFTGIGSPEIALRSMGVDFEVVGISEVDKYAIIAYRNIHHGGEVLSTQKDINAMLKEMNDAHIAYNFSTGENEMPKKYDDVKTLYDSHVLSKNFGDIRNIDETKIPDFDLLTYSFPCKNISVAGTQLGLKKGSQTQSSLIWECERIIRHKKPKYLLMENVKNLIGEKHIDDFERWIEKLSGMGYTSKYKVLNASDFGVPQNRERVMMVSVLDGVCHDLPNGTPTALSVDDIVEPHNTVDPKLYYKHGDIQFMSKTVVPSQLNHIGNVGGRIHSNSRVYSSVGYSPTLNSMNGGNRQPKIHFGEFSRRLSPLECWRLMGYSDTDFYKAEKSLPKSKLYERSGRGIVVPMLVEIFKTMDCCKMDNYVRL